MEINKVIKKQRTRLGLTQEKVARALGVSSSAVYKWEKGSSYPDITLLAPLARLLQIDVNSLLHFEERLTAKEIGKFANSLGQLTMEKGIEEGFLWAQDKIKEYPTDDLLIYTAATLLQGTLLLQGEKTDKKYQEYQNIIEQWLIKTSNSSEIDVKEQSQKSLIYYYINQNNLPKAKELLAEVHESQINKKEIQAKIYLKEEKYGESQKVLEEQILKKGMEVYQALSLLITLALKEKDVNRAKALNEKLMAVVKTFDQWHYNNFVGTLKIAIEEKNKEETLYILDEILLATQKPWNIGESVLYQKMETKPFNKESLREFTHQLIASLEEDETLNFIKDEEAWADLIQKHQ